MHGRHHRAARVHDDAHARGVESGVFGAAHARAQPLGGRGGQGSAHRRAVDAGLLERLALAQDSGDAAPAARAAPSDPPETRRRRSSRVNSAVVSSWSRSIDADTRARTAGSLTARATPSRRRRTRARARPARPDGCRGPGSRCVPGLRTRPAWRACARESSPAARTASVGSRLPCSATGRVGQPAAGVRGVGLPVDADDVGTGRRGDLLERPAGARRKGDDRRAGPAGDPDGLREVRQRELAEVARAERAGPRVEELHGLRAGLAPGPRGTARPLGPAARAARGLVRGSCTSSRLAWVNAFDPCPSTM